MARVYIETYGCQMNDADSQYIADRALAAGYSVAQRPEDANVVILNTCTVRDNAERRAYGRVHHFKLLKERDPAIRLVVTGCLAEQDRDRMRRLAPHIDAIFGTKELVQLGDHLGAWRPEYDVLHTIDDERLASEEVLLEPFGGKADGITGPYSHLRAFVTVQRGCSYYCTFCIVPHVRGRFDHRPMSAIVSEVQACVENGAREVMLVGQTVNAWHDAGGADFGDLCRALREPERLTFISPHPKDFTEKMIRDLADLPSMNPRIHLPMQSGSDAVLRRMNRKYTRAQFTERVEWVRRYLPHWAITTDIIVGFPGESEGDFAQTLDVVESGIFANAFTFIYSQRRGTPAARWEQVPHEIVAERFRRLVEAQNAATQAYHTSKVGAVSRCLIVGNSKKDPTKLAAKSGENVTVIVRKPSDYDEAEYARTPWLDIEIETAHLWGCTGSVVRRAEHVNEGGLAVARPLVDLLSGPSTPLTALAALRVTS